MVKYLLPAIFGVAVSVLAPLAGITGPAVMFVIGVGAVGMFVGNVSS